MEKTQLFNEFFYDVLDSMEDLARNTVLDLEESEREENDRAVLVLCKKLSEALKKMDKKEVFSDNLIGFCSTLSPVEEDILFYNLAVNFYEIWQDLYAHEDDEEDDAEGRVDAFAIVMASEMIIRFLDDYLGYGYFMEEE